MYPQIMPPEQIAPEAPAVYKAVTDQAVDSYANAAQPRPVAAMSLDPEQFKNRLLDIGQEFQNGGMSSALWKVQQDQDLLHTILKNPEAIKQIAGNQNPKNETPAGTGVNAVVKSVSLSESVSNMAKNLGINLGSGEKIPPQLQGSFMDGIKQVFTDSQIKPGSIEAVAQRDYFTALLTGKGIGGAMEAYGARYNQLADESRKFGNDVALESAKKQLDYQMKNQERIALTKSTTDGVGRILAGEGSNLPAATIAEVQNQVSNIMANAHKEPEAAGGAARTLVQQLSEMNIGEKQLTGIAKTLSGVVKMDKQKQELYDQLSTAGLGGSAALARWQFDIATDADNKKISAAIDDIRAKKSAAEAKAAAEKQTAEALAKSQAALTPIEVPGKPGVFMTPQAIEAQGKVVEQKALIPGKVDEANALIPTKVNEQRALIPGKVSEASQVAGATASAQMPYQKEMETFKTGQQKELANFKSALELSTAEAKQYAESIGTKRGEAMAALPSQISSAEQAVTTIKSLKESMNGQMIQTNVGVKAPIGSLLSLLPATQSRDFNGILETLKSEQFLAAVRGMKGLGALSDQEGKRVEAAIAKLDKFSSVEQFNKNLDIVQTSLGKMIEENRKFAETGKVSANPRPVGGAVESSAAPKVKKYNPQTGKVE